MESQETIGTGWRLGVALLLAIYLGLGWIYVLVKPLGQAPDEFEHATYMVVLYQYKKLPRMWTPETEGIGQGDEPPLYYATLAAVLQVIQPDLTTEAGRTRAYRLVRGVTLTVFGFGFLLLTIALSRRLAPGHGPLVFLTLALTAFLPMFLHLASSIANGVAADLFSTALLVLGVSVLQSTAPLSVRRHLLHGLVIALALLSKMTVLPVVAVVGPLFLWSAWRSSHRIRSLAMLSLPVVVISGPWFVWNMVVSGEPVAFDAVMTTFLRADEASPRGLRLEHLPGIWRYFLGVLGFGFPPMGISFYPTWVYAGAFAAAAAASVLGPIVARVRGTWIPIRPRSVVPLLGVAVILTGLFFFYINWRIQHLQSRYMFVVLPVLTFAVARAVLAAFGKRARAVVAIAGAAAMVALCVWGIFLLDPASR